MTTKIPNRLMPERVRLGNPMQSTMSQPIYHYNHWKENPEEANPTGRRTVMGYVLPDWQRGLVWSKDQMISFVESAWRGIPLGTYSFNQGPIGSEYDNLLIDGQQRLYAIQCYIEDQFPVFGHYWSEVTKVDGRFFGTSTHFGCYITSTEDEQYLRNYYNLMNFGGTSHKNGDRA